MLVWVIVLAGLIAIVIISQRQTFPTQADRTAYAAIANTPAVAALTGLPYAAGTLGGILNVKIWMTDAVALAFAVIFLVARNGRAEEESGRTELLRAGALGRHAYTLANWVMVAIFSVVTGLACTGAAIAEGLPGYGALVMGASLAGVGLVFLGIAAVAGQLAQTSRGANGIATIVLGVAYLLRAGGDLAAKHDVAGGLSWASPLGWGQAMRSFGENNWAPLLLLVGVGLVLCLVSLRLEATRDLGAGLLPDRPGPRTASALTQTPTGLTLRLQRWSILGWGIGILIGGLFFGAVATAMANLLGGNTAAVTAFLGPSKNVLSGLVGYFTMAEALLIAAFVLQSIATIRSEEANGSVELQWTGAISRVRWAASRIVVPAVASLVVLVISGYAEGASYGAAVHDPSQAGHYVGVALAYWPTMLLVIGVVVFLAAWLPRASLTISWVVYGVVVFVSMFAGLLTLPDWLANNTPFTAIEHMTTGTSFNALPLVVLAVLAIVLAILGLARLRSRDYVSG
jgi:ABC-2 type transport system permease protein